MRLEDTVIVVTGASRGLGRAMADAFVREGARVVYSSRSANRLTEAVEAVASGTGSGEAIAVPADVRSWPAVQALVTRANDAYGAIDVLVNNAGVTQSKVDEDHLDKPVAEMSIETWDTVIETNLRGAFLCAKAVLPGMRERDQGRLIHISSGHGVAGRAGRAAYVASKFGLEGLHETISLEVAGTGVDSLCLRPPSGGVYTAGAASIGRVPEEFTFDDPGVIAEPAVRLATGEGDNGGRYQATPDGEGYVEYEKGDRS